MNQKTFCGNVTKEMYNGQLIKVEVKMHPDTLPGPWIVRNKFGDMVMPILLGTGKASGKRYVELDTYALKYLKKKEAWHEHKYQCHQAELRGEPQPAMTELAKAQQPTEEAPPEAPSTQPEAPNWQTNTPPAFPSESEVPAKEEENEEDIPF